MKKMISLLLCAMMAVSCSVLASCTYGDQEDEEWWQSDARREADEEYERDWATKPPKPTEKPTEEPSFMETICGTYLVSGTGHLTGNAWYDEDLTTQDRTYTNLALHVSQVDENTVEIDVEGGLQGSGTVSAESPTVSYTGVEEDGDNYQVTVTFTVNDGGARVDFSFHSSDSDSTEDMKLSGEK
ncbi:MAG: hypothetical protein J5590_07075 [Clostridia bacterium]|nr:hypothetical protein [Clostridia bacterium]